MMDKEFGSDKFKSGNLELFIEQTDHDYFRIPPRYPECDSGQGVSSDERFQQVEIEQENFSKNCLMFRVAVQFTFSGNRTHTVTVRMLYKANGNTN